MSDLNLPPLHRFGDDSATGWPTEDGPYCLYDYVRIREHMLLTEIQGLRQAVADARVEGWEEAAKAWEACASIHSLYANYKDPLFRQRQKEFLASAESAHAMLAAQAKGGD